MRADRYSVGVYFADPKVDQNITLTLTFTGQYCKNQSFDGVKCVAFETFPVNATITGGKPKYYILPHVNPDAKGQVLTSLSYSLTSTLPTTTSSMNASYLGLPRITLNDFVGTSSITLNSPTPGGQWILSVALNQSDFVNFTTTSNYLCTNETDCGNRIKDVSSDPKNALQKDITLSKKYDVSYYAVYGSTLNGLLATVQDASNDEKDPKVSIYAAFNRVPSFNNNTKMMEGFDYSGCTVSYCAKVSAINTNITSVTTNTNGTWYVAILANRDASKYNIWFGSVCASNCSNQGSCQTDAANYGLCKCNDGYEGLTCTPASNLLIEYMILIIIAALVLISALLGLIAWAYMRRRSQYVEVR
jgi:hypothetical protein